MPYKAMNWSKPKTSVISRDSFSNIMTGEQRPDDANVPSTSGAGAAAAAADEALRELEDKKDHYMFRPGRVPPYRQMFYQFKDIILEEAQKIIRENVKPVGPGLPNVVCDEKHGWFQPGSDQKLRDLLTEQISQHLAADGGGGAGDDAGEEGAAGGGGESLIGEEEEEADDVIDSSEDDDSDE